MGAPFDHPLIHLPENEFARAAVERLLGPDPDFAPRLVYLYGPAGSGKSHLVLQYVQNFLDQYQEVRYRLLPLYEFTSMNLEAASQGTEGEALQSLLDVDLLVCEELQQIEFQPWLQKKLILVIDELLQSGARILITSQKAIGEFAQATPKLTSRCHAGITASLTQPCKQSRISLLQHFAEQRNLSLPPEITEELARQLPVSPRELFGAVVQLEALHNLEKKELTRDLIQEFLLSQQQRPCPSLSEIAKSVAREFGVTVQSIRSATREQSLLIPRQMAMFLSRELIQANYADIGHYYGGRSHSTVMHACQALLKKTNQSPELSYRLVQLRQLLQGQGGNTY